MQISVDVDYSQILIYDALEFGMKLCDIRVVSLKGE